MFNKNDEKIANENIILKGRPNLFLSCKKVFALLIFLGAISYISPIALDYIVQIQGQLLYVVNLPIVKVATWIIFIIIFSIIVWIIWTLISWTAREYTISDHRITYKTGILFTKTINMHYSKIQDVIVSQGLLGRLISVGTITIYSGYDGSNLELENINRPNNVEEIIFEEINKLHFHYPNQFAMNSNDFVNDSNSYPRQDNDFNRRNNYNGHDNNSNDHDENHNRNYNGSNNNQGSNYNNNNNPNSQKYHDQNNYNNLNNSYYNSYDNNKHYDNRNPHQNNSGISQNLNHKIKDNYHSSSIEKGPKKGGYGPITNFDFPFLKKDIDVNDHNNRHDVSDFVENPENYQNSSSFLNNNSVDDISEIKNESSYDENYSNNDFTNDYFDKTMNQPINKLDEDFKFKNNNEINPGSDFYNQNQEQDNSYNQDHNQNKYQENYLNQNNYQNMNNFHNNYNNNNNSNYNDSNQNNYDQNNYNKNDYSNINNNSNQGNSQNINNNINNNFNNESRSKSKNKEYKSKDILERHFKKFRK